MRCPFCRENQDRVIDSREVQQGGSIRRRRECTACHRRFTTYERVEEVPLMVVKKDGRREVFSRAKLRNGLIRACSKRPVSMETIDGVVDEVESHLQGLGMREVPAERIGERVMERLRELDQVAYVRFASVYSRFEDISQFLQEVRNLLGKAPEGV